MTGNTDLVHCLVLLGITKAGLFKEKSSFR